MMPNLMQIIHSWLLLGFVWRDGAVLGEEGSSVPNDVWMKPLFCTKVLIHFATQYPLFNGTAIKSKAEKNLAEARRRSKLHWKFYFKLST